MLLEVLKFSVTMNWDWRVLWDGLCVVLSGKCSYVLGWFAENVSDSSSVPQSVVQHGDDAHQQSVAGSLRVRLLCNTHTHTHTVSAAVLTWGVTIHVTSLILWITGLLHWLTLLFSHSGGLGGAADSVWRTRLQEVLRGFVLLRSWTTQHTRVTGPSSTRLNTTCLTETSAVSTGSVFTFSTHSLKNCRIHWFHDWLVF